MKQNCIKSGPVKKDLDIKPFGHEVHSQLLSSCSVSLRHSFLLDWLCSPCRQEIVFTFSHTNQDNLHHVNGKVKSTQKSTA